ncbi:hypothetical protein C6P45_003501 [Maudiozyma exigua]|uniref:Uncharacterized protein n=1 Tax=Maudiozyma exigua TaxID=34358 RepID=A0A9P7B1X0_MAUEX|nr:hypothetical protein C6P45_003501 [Kazachstania exigua]
MHTYTGSNNYIAEFGKKLINNLDAQVADIVLEGFQLDTQMSVADFVGLLHTQVPFLTDQGIYFFDRHSQPLAHENCNTEELQKEIGPIEEYYSIAQQAAEQDILNPTEVQTDINDDLDELYEILKRKGYLDII